MATNTFFYIVLLTLYTIVKGQFLHPQNDQIYLDAIEQRVQEEVLEAKHLLQQETEIFKNLTAPFVVAILKKKIHSTLEEMSPQELKSAILTSIEAQKQFQSGWKSKSPKQETETAETEAPDNLSLELGNIITGIVFKNLKVLAHVPNIFVESLKKGFPGVFSLISPTPLPSSLNSTQDGGASKIIKNKLE